MSAGCASTGKPPAVGVGTVRGLPTPPGEPEPGGGREEVRLSAGSQRVRSRRT